jgi:hypothetical protein
MAFQKTECSSVILALGLPFEKQKKRGNTIKNLSAKKFQFFHGIVLYLRPISSLAQLVRASDC